MWEKVGILPVLFRDLHNIDIRRDVCSWRQSDGTVIDGHIRPGHKSFHGSALLEFFGGVGGIIARIEVSVAVCYDLGCPPFWYCYFLSFLSLVPLRFFHHTGGASQKRHCTPYGTGQGRRDQWWPWWPWWPWRSRYFLATAWPRIPQEGPVRM